MHAKNLILYGPPGTGKTYNSIDKAVEIVTGKVSTNHSVNKTLFDELRKQGQIEFVTFHQNYAYEDFMVAKGQRVLFKKEVKNGTEKEIKDATHYVFISNPDETEKLIRGFLK